MNFLVPIEKVRVALGGFWDFYFVWHERNLMLMYMSFSKERSDCGGLKKLIFLSSIFQKLTVALTFLPCHTIPCQHLTKFFTMDPTPHTCSYNIKAEKKLYSTISSEKFISSAGGGSDRNKNGITVLISIIVATNSSFPFIQKKKRDLSLCVDCQ